MRTRIPLRALALALAALALGACSQADPQAANTPKAKAVVPTDATTVGSVPGVTTATTDAPVKTIEDVRSTLTADGTLDSDQADCLLGNLKGSLSDADVIKTFAAANLSAVTAPQRDAVIKAFTACVPKEVLVKPVGASVQQAATAKGVTVSNAEVECITKQIAAAISYEDLLVVSPDGKGGLTDATATTAVKACIAPEAYAALGIGG